VDSHFAKYVDSGKLAGWHIVVTRRGEVAHSSTYGHRDIEAGAPVTPDTLWRVYSMTKPVTSVAAMMLWEEGRFELTDEISTWLPEFADVRVYDKGSALRPYTVPAVEPIRVWHLLTHTSGLTYGFLQTSVVDALYRNAGYELGGPAGVDLARACQDWARLPLLFQPGTRWGYSVATDVLGRLVEVVSGQSLDEFFAERIFGPLGITDIRWLVDGDDAQRLAALYAPTPATGKAFRYDVIGTKALQKPTMLSGGGGLISTAADYTDSPDAAARRTVRRWAPTRQPHPAVHDPQPPARRRRPPDAVDGRIRRDHLRGHRLRTRLRGRAGPRAE
jgi:CubicO group peptidase (beta-lactamase class C family)